MIRKEFNGIHWLEFKLLADRPNLKHGIFLRHGGASMGAYTSLNLAEHVGDNLQHVQANLRKISEILEIPNLSWNAQCHGIAIHEVTSSVKTPRSGDALTTKTRGLGLVVHHADCQAAIFYDPQNHALANVHAGWRGNVQNIYKHTIDFMANRYGSKPEHLLVCISPSLGPASAEFINFKTELPFSFWEHRCQPDSLFFNLWSISRMQLLHAGILPEHIEIAAIDTASHPQDFFSYRRNKITGRHGTVAALM